MTSPVFHAESSARLWGGTPEDYQPIHDWFDATKEVMPDFRHRALRHHSHGIFEAERVFGPYIVNSDGHRVPVRYIGEQHVKEDCGGIVPTVSDWLSKLPVEHAARDAATMRPELALEQRLGERSCLDFSARAHIGELIADFG